MSKNKKQNLFSQRGTTLIELLISVAIFSAIMLSATAIFRMVIEGQRNAVASQNIQESVRYVFEMMSKEMRSAQKTGVGECSNALAYVYSTQNNKLNFKNKNGECVTYELESDRIKITRSELSGLATPSAVKVSNLKFSVLDDNATQPRATIRMDMETSVGKDEHKQKMSIETTISSRFYE